MANWYMVGDTRVYDLTCGEKVVIEGDYLGQDITFSCELGRGHEGRHSTGAVMQGSKLKYTVTWENEQ